MSFDIFGSRKSNVNKAMSNKAEIEFLSLSGAPAGGNMGRSPDTEKNCCEKWSYFPELYKITQVYEDRRENW